MRASSGGRSPQRARSIGSPPRSARSSSRCACAADAGGYHEILWFGSRDGWVRSDGIIAAARIADLRTARFETPLRPAEEVASQRGLEGRSADGYDLEVGVVPSFSADGERTELMLRVSRGTDHRGG